MNAHFNTLASYLHP